MNRRERPTFWILDWLTIGLYVGIAILSCIMVYASGYDPDSPTSIFNFSTRAGRQILFFLLSIGVGSVIMLLNPQLFKSFAYVFYGICIGLLVIVMTYGAVTKGAMSWFTLPGGLKFQPSEITKLATAIALSTYMSTPTFSLKNLRHTIIALGIFLLPAALVVLQGDAGSALVFMAFLIPFFREGFYPWVYVLLLTVISLFVSSLIYDILSVLTVTLLVASGLSILSAKKKMYWWVAYIILVGVVIYFFKNEPFVALLGTVAFLISSVIVGMWRGKREIASLILICSIAATGFAYSVNYFFNEVLKPHQQDRINVWLMPEKADKRGAYYNLRQSKLAIGSGGLLGKGALNGEMTQGDHVPEQHTDFIFTVIGEEHGFFGVLSTVVLYVLLLLRLSYIAERQRSKFTRIYTYGIAGIFSIHLLINVGMTIGLMPVIGIPLPLMSYGGSSLLSFSLMLAILLRFDSQRLLVFR